MNPKNAFALGNRGEVHRRLKNYKQAWIDLGKALDIDSQNSAALLARGKTYYEWSKNSTEIDQIDIKYQDHSNRYISWINPEEITVVADLAKGGFGMVHVAEWQSSCHAKVALKTFHNGYSTTTQLPFQNEVCQAINFWISR